MGQEQRSRPLVKVTQPIRVSGRTGFGLGRLTSTLTVSATSPGAMAARVRPCVGEDSAGGSAGGSAGDLEVPVS